MSVSLMPVMPARWARNVTASGKLQPWCCITRSNTSPPNLAHVAEPNLLLDIEAKRGMFIRLMKETTSPPFDPLAPHRLAGQRRYHLRKGTGVPNAVAVEPMHPRSS